MSYISIDLFSGAGGMSEGLKMAHFRTKYAFEIDPIAAMTYQLNHSKTKVFTQDIRTVDTKDIRKGLRGKTIHLLAGCPPCQGFSSIRRLNRDKPAEDERNFLINEYVRFLFSKIKVSHLCLERLLSQEYGLVEYPFVINSMEEPKSIYELFLLILDNLETIIFAAGPAEIKNIIITKKFPLSLI